MARFQELPDKLPMNSLRHHIRFCMKCQDTILAHMTTYSNDLSINLLDDVLSHVESMADILVGVVTR
jgi:hypothetical protein